MKKVSVLFLTLSLVPTLLFAESPTKEMVLIKTGKLIDVRGGRTLTDQAILIEGD